MTDEELKKKDLFDAFLYVTDSRQKAFIATYKKMFDEEKVVVAQTSKCKKIIRFLGKAIIGLIILAFVYPLLKALLYKSMGWELIVEPPPPEYQAPPMKQGWEPPVQPRAGDRTFEEYYQEESESFKKTQEVEYDFNNDDDEEYSETIDRDEL